MAADTVEMMKAALLKAQEDIRRTQSETQQTIDSLRKELDFVKSNKTPRPRGQGLEATMCKSFGATLSGPALQWLISLKPGSIQNFPALINKFYLQLASNRVLEKHTGDLYRITQKTNEAVRQYLDRFNKEMISVKSLDIPSAIEAFRKGLTYRSRLYYELTRYPCSTFEEVRARAMAEIRVEEDKVSRYGSEPSYDRKAQNQKKSDWRHQPYQKRETNSVANKATGKYADNDYPSIASYYFNVDARDVVNALKKLGTPARWPRKSNGPDREKDTTKWCSYHGDHGHRTEDGNALKKEVDWLLKKGYLEHLMGKKGQREDKSDPTQQQPRPPPEPTHDKIINSISEGSEICGLTYSAAKRFAREGSKAVPKQYRSAEEKKLKSMTISFDEEDGDEEADHHDGLVVSLTVSNCIMKRVLIDNGSSANIIFKSALESMGLQEVDILKKITVLFGFNGESATTLGEIMLPTYAKGVNLQTKFNVVDCPSAYNIIMGTPWIHKMRVVPSTYH